MVDFPQFLNIQSRNHVREITVISNKAVPLPVYYYGICDDIHTFFTNSFFYFIYISYVGKHISAKYVYYYSLLAIIYPKGGKYIKIQQHSNS